jgi:TPP-dependent pyruvate/acetoin dehydrogenase alpha subunit
VLACSNNGYAISTPVEEAIACKKLIELAAPFGIPAAQVDGADVEAVAAATAKAVEAARKGAPQFLEFDCERLASHSTLTREARSPAELAKLRDPIALYEARHK